MGWEAMANCIAVQNLKKQAALLRQPILLELI